VASGSESVWPSIIAAAAVLGGVAVGQLGLFVGRRHERKRAHDERIWRGRVEAYAAFLDWEVPLMRLRHQAMDASAHDAPAVPREADDEAIPVLNKLLMFASNEVRASGADAFNVHEEWLAAYGSWRSHQMAPEPHHDHGWADELAALHGRAMAACELADLHSTRVLESIRQEILTGKPALLTTARLEALRAE
jgi:hypothetical protein